MPALLRRRGALIIAAVVVLLVVVSGCGGSSPSSTPSGKLSVVAAEDFWGSIAAQLGGDYVAVKNLIDNPDADPHAYEPTPADGRAVASAKLVIVNGIGYDPWADQLVSANPVAGRAVVKVGDVA